MKARPLLWFFGLAYGISWLLWLPLVLASTGLFAGRPPVYLHLAGGLGPLLAGWIVSRGTGQSRRLLARSVRGRGRWIAFALLVPAGLFALAAALAVLAGRSIDLAQVGRSVEYPDLPLPLYWAANVLFYGFGEEVGWRGFALPRLEARRSTLRAALLLGLLWAGWHLPLFAFTGGLSSMSVAGAAGWLVSMLVGSVLMAWLWHASGGSILVVALFHGALDIFMTSPVAPEVASIMGALLALGTIWLVRTRRALLVSHQGA